MRDWMVVIESHQGARSVHYGTQSECEWIATNRNRLWIAVDGPRLVKPKPPKIAG